MVFSSIIEGGAGSGLESIGNTTILNSAVILPLGQSVKRLCKAEREAFELRVESKEGQALVGLILGDGWFLRNKSKLGGFQNSRFCFSQSVVHSDYFYFVYKFFKSYCQGSPYQFNKFSKLTGPTSGLRFNTMNLPCFNFYYDLFYKHGKKHIPFNIIEYLTPISLAFWIQDDGYYHKRDRLIGLCTDGFSESEVDLLMEALTKKLSLKCRKERKNTRYRIIIVTSSMDKVKNMVLEHFDESMKYKLGLI